MVIEKVKLDPGDIQCPECGGNGSTIIYLYHIEKNEIIEDGSPQLIKCRFCDGKGKFDWIDNITRKISNREYIRNINREARKGGMVEFRYRKLTTEESNKLKRYF